MAMAGTRILGQADDEGGREMGRTETYEPRQDTRHT